MSIEFILTAFVICLMPGIGVVYTISTALGGGLRAGIWASIGCTLATVFHLGIAAAGLAAVLHTSAMLFQAVKYAGVAYLLWMAWGVLRDRGGLSLTAAQHLPPLRIIWRAILLNILNPKIPLFFVAFLPQFLPADAGLGMIAEMGAVFSALTLVTFLGYAVLASLGRGLVISSPRAMTWMRRAFAASFAGLGLRLALDRA